jgi:hypothetical protein
MTNWQKSRSARDARLAAGSRLAKGKTPAFRKTMSAA